jgi:hypothetical protein
VPKFPCVGNSGLLTIAPLDPNCNYQDNSVFTKSSLLTRWKRRAAPRSLVRFRVRGTP